MLLRRRRTWDGPPQLWLVGKLPPPLVVFLSGMGHTTQTRLEPSPSPVLLLFLTTGQVSRRFSHGLQVCRAKAAPTGIARACTLARLPCHVVRPILRLGPSMARRNRGHPSSLVSSWERKAAAERRLPMCKVPFILFSLVCPCQPRRRAPSQHLEATAACLPACLPAWRATSGPAYLPTPASRGGPGIERASAIFRGASRRRVYSLGQLCHEATPSLPGIQEGGRGEGAVPLVRCVALGLLRCPASPRLLRLLEGVTVPCAIPPAPVRLIFLFLQSTDFQKSSRRRPARKGKSGEPRVCMCCAGVRDETDASGGFDTQFSRSASVPWPRASPDVRLDGMCFAEVCMHLKLLRTETAGLYQPPARRRLK